VVRVGPRQVVAEALAAGEHGLGLIVEAVALPGSGVNTAMYLRMRIDGTPITIT